MAGKAENQCLVLLAKFGHGGQESSPKPPQAICKPLSAIRNKVVQKKYYICNINKK